MTMQVVAPGRREASSPGKFGQVLQFRRRPDPSLYPILTAEPAALPLRPETSADNDFARYEQEHEEPIDYRQRMLMNMIAVAIVIVLISSGVWIADTISVSVKAQDCALQGRTNCAPIEAPARHQ
jgi:hypothetical protein